MIAQSRRKKLGEEPKQAEPLRAQEPQHTTRKDEESHDEGREQRTNETEQISFGVWGATEGVWCGQLQ
jgi:uncharacterized cupin superfamily protein